MKRYRFLILGLVIIFSAVALVPVVAFPWKENVSWQKYALAYQAHVFNVDTTVDEVDANIGDGICLTATGNCSLRAAVEEANQIPTDGNEVNIELPAGTYILSQKDHPVDDFYLGIHRNSSNWVALNGQGAANTIIQGAGSAGVLQIIYSVILNEVTIQNGNSGIWGGGIDLAQNGDLTVMNSVIRSNKSASWGGGIFVDYLSYLTLIDTSLYSNQADLGGGLYNHIGYVTVKNSTLSSNTAVEGGGIFDEQPDTSLYIENSTLSGNTAQKGGGLYKQSYGETDLKNVTIANNTASVSGGGIEVNSQYISDAGPIWLADTIIAGNHNASSPDCLVETGNITSSGYNLIGNSTGCTFVPAASDRVGQDARLGNLRNNGGSTKTQALLFHSLAIDAGDPAGCGLATDQRGVTRPLDGNGDGIARCDIGAYETVRLYGVFLPKVSK